MPVIEKDVDARGCQLQVELIGSGFDFAVVDGEIAWDRLFSNTKTDVIMQMDIGNCAAHLTEEEERTIAGYRFLTEYLRPEVRLWAGLTGYQWLGNGNRYKARVFTAKAVGAYYRVSSRRRRRYVDLA